jgi:hypothetical protein
VGRSGGDAEAQRSEERQVGVTEARRHGGSESWWQRGGVAGWSDGNAEAWRVESDGDLEVRSV